MNEKGTLSNPYSQEEFYAMLNAGTWPGGYVQGLGYCMAEITVVGSSSSSDASESDSSDSSEWSDISDPFSDPDNIGDLSNPDDNDQGSNSSSDGSSSEDSGSNSSGGGGSGSARVITISGKTNGISSYTYNILKNLPYYSGEIYITSVARTVEEQARAMLNNIKKSGVDSQIRIYAESGEIVINVYNENSSDEENLRNMIAKIYEVGPSNVSKHCADPSVMNVFDVSRSRLSDVNTFIVALKAAGVKNPLDEPDNGCVHIEIPQ